MRGGYLWVRKGLSLQSYRLPPSGKTNEAVRLTAAQGIASAEEISWSDEPRPLTDSEKKALIQRIIRTNILSEVAATRLASAQSSAQSGRPDLDLRREREEQLLKQIEALAPQYRARPSLFRAVASALGYSLGLASLALPQKASGAITGAVQDALTERYNSQLRELRVAGLSDSEKQLRDAVKELRDEERAPEGTIQAPDILKMQRPQELSAAELLAGAVKYSVGGLLSIGSRI